MHAKSISFPGMTTYETLPPKYNWSIIWLQCWNYWKDSYPLDLIGVYFLYIETLLLGTSGYVSQPSRASNKDLFNLYFNPPELSHQRYTIYIQCGYALYRENN